MHIGFDISQTGATKAGCGYYAHAMIGALLEMAPQHQFSLYPSFGDFYFDAHMPRDNPYAAPNARYGPRQETLEQAQQFWASPGLERALGAPDVVHSNNFWCPTQLRASRLIYTLHDLSFLVDPAWTTEANREACLQGVRRAAAHADWIAAVSAASRDHYLRVFPEFPADRIRVVHPCSRFSDPNAEGTRPSALAGVTPGGYWLSVGTIEPRKNQKRIAEAYARWRAESGRDTPLVFAGGQGWLMDDFRSHLERLGVRQHVILTGYVSDMELVWLYRNCLANLYVSYFEGFGLPVLEGMQFGAPTVASTATSIPEVTGDAAVLVDPNDTQGIVRAMVDLEREPERMRLSRAAVARAAQFDWKSSAAAMLRLYEDAVSLGKRRPSGTRPPAWRRLIRYGERLYRRAVR